MATASSIQNTHCLSVRDILAHKSTMFNYKLPSDRTMYESSLIYCNLCDYSCDLTDKSAIICHYLAKHPDDNIVYSYLWPQMEQNQVNQTYKVKYYLIKAHLKIRTKEQQQQSHTTQTVMADLDQLVYPVSLLSENESIDEQQNHQEDQQDAMETDQPASTDSNISYVMNRMLDWLDKNLMIEQSVLNTSNSAEQQQPPVQQDDVQELEEEQEVQEVEMFSEDAYDTQSQAVPANQTGSTPSGITSAITHSSSASATAASTTSNSTLDDLIKLSSSASFFYNQQKLTAGGTVTSSSNSFLLDNSFLVHLLAINKIENAFRLKQIHDYYGGCFICSKQVEFNMKHYQTHFNSEMTAYICLHCNYKEFRQETNLMLTGNTSTDSSGTANSSFPSFNMKSSCLRVYEMRAGSPVNYETSRYCIKLYNSCIFLFSSLSYLLYI